MHDWNPEANDIFLKALDLPAPDDRRAFLDDACAARPELRARVDALLAANAGAGSFLDAPPPGLSGTVDEPTVTERPGTVVGPYKLMEQIGEGGMGLVFVAEQQHPVRRKVALKVIKPGMDTRDVIARFEQERQALALMDHPNIAKVLDAGATDTGRPYFVMELVRGVPITEYCDTNQLTPKERLGLFVSVCHAVQHAHQKGVVHRDLKPSNVLVTLHDGTPVVKVIDFGVAKAVGQHLTEKTIYTRFAQMIGTPLYMSPEQAEMSGLDIDTRSDVYSLGVLLYELLTGTTPFDRQRILKAAFDEVRRIIREEDPPKPSTRLSTLGATLSAVSAKRRTEPRKLSALVKGDLDWIVMRALEKDRTRRYETANGLARDVQRYLADEPVEACPPSAGYKLRKFARRYKTWLVTAGAFLSLLAVGTAVSTWQALRATTAEHEARAQRDAARAAQEAAEDQRRLALDKEAAAVREADKARTLVGMLQELLGTANPNATKGPDYTVRQLLDDFAPAVGERLKDQPEAEADLRMTIGLAYRYMRLDAKAEQQFRRAVELRRQVFGLDHRKLAQALIQLAWSLHLQLNWPASEEQSRAALAILRRLDDPGEDLASALRIRAFTLEFQGKNPDEAEAMVREALAVAERCAGGKPTPLVVEVTDALAHNLMTQRRPAEGVTIATRAVELHRIIHGDQHPSTGHGLWILGSNHHLLGHVAEAERAYREALTNFRRAHGSQPHQHTLLALGSLAHVLDDQFREQEADAVLREFQSDWKVADLPFPEAAQVVVRRAIARLNRGDYAGAESLFRQALEGQRKPPGLASILNVEAIMLQYAVGGTLFLQGKEEAAHAALQALVLPAQMAALKADVRPELRTALAFALVVGGSGKAEELQAARTHARKALEPSRSIGQGERAIASFVLALADRRSGDLDRAIASLREAQTLVQPHDPFVRREVEALLVKCLREKGDLAAAEAVLRDGVSERQAAQPKGDPQLAAAQVRLAAVLADQQRYADAEPLLLTAHEALRTHPQVAASAFLKERRADAADRLARLYDAWGKPDEAAKWRKELEATKPAHP
jgi:serine/threonine protein kinase